MLKNLRSYLFPLRLLVFWLLFFVAFRLWFVLWLRSEWSETQPFQVWMAFWHALPLDFSFAAYLMVIPVLFWQLGVLMGNRSYAVVERGVFWYNILVVSIFIFVFGANVFVYEEWKTPLNNRAVEYFKTPSGLLDSMSLLFKTVSVLLYLGFLSLTIFAYTKLVGRKIYPQAIPRLSALALPIWLGLVVLAIRGGWGVMPINESAVYFSTHLFDNHAATNPGWSVGHSLVETRSTVNRYAFLNQDTARQRVSCLLGHCHPPPQSPTLTLPPFFNTSVDSLRPNVVFLILESHTAQVMEELGGEKGVCPNMSRLIREGVLFERLFSSGYRTDQGLISILAGYPAQPDQSIILLEDKANKLPSIPKILKEKGYSSAFFYGGELTFANLGLWLANQRFDKIHSIRNFSNAEKTQRWGADDHTLLQHTILEINTLPEPFFATAMTLSLHPPYDVPFQGKWRANTDREKFLNSAEFVDQAIGAFFESARKQPWYANTVFVLVADHGASQPGGLGMDKPASRHLPLIVYCPALSLAWKGKRMSAYGNVHDIPATILRMLDVEQNSFDWSRNLWEIGGVAQTQRNASTKDPGFAFYTNEDGIGWITGLGNGFFEFGRKKWRIFEGEVSETDRADAQSYLQVLYDDYLSK